MSNQFIASEHPLGTGPKLDAACNVFAREKHERTWLIQIYIHLLFYLRTPGQTRILWTKNRRGSSNRHENPFISGQQGGGQSASALQWSMWGSCFRNLSAPLLYEIYWIFPEILLPCLWKKNDNIYVISSEKSCSVRKCWVLCEARWWQWCLLFSPPLELETFVRSRLHTVSCLILTQVPPISTHVSFMDSVSGLWVVFCCPFGNIVEKIWLFSEFIFPSWQVFKKRHLKLWKS